MRYVFILLLGLTACSQSTSLKKLEWKSQGASDKPLEIEIIKYSKAPSLTANSEKIILSQQTISGIPVDNTYIKLIRNSENSDKEIKALYSDALIENSIYIDQAHQFKKQQDEFHKKILAKYPYFSKQKNLVFEPLAEIIKSKVQFVWSLKYFDKSGQPWEARIGDKLEIKRLQRIGSQFHDTLAIIYPAGPRKSQLETVKLSSLKVTPTLSNDNLQVMSQADNKISELQSVFSYTPEDSRFDQVQVFYYLQESLKWFKEKINFTLPFQLQAEVHVGHPDKTNAAFYYSGKIRLGTGDNETYKNISQDPSIVVHESVHALIDSLSGLPFDGEGGAINEGIADFITALQLNTPHMAEASYLKGPYRRSVDNTYRLQDKNGGLYHDSGIISGLLWEIRQKIGADKARDLVVFILNRLTPGSDFADFNSILKQAAVEHLELEGDKKIIESITLKRGFAW